MPKPAAVRFYFDEDILGVAKIIAQLRSDVTYPGDSGAVIKGHERPACFLARAGKDRKWIPLVAEAGWLVVTRDAAIQRHPAEIAAVRDSGGRMVVLSGKEGTSTWTQLEIVMTQWRAIEALVDQTGPFIYNVTRTGPLRSVPL